jgi:hypothetical protein
MNNTIRFAVLLSAGIAATGSALAQRGEVVLWEKQNFEGRHLTITDDVGDLALRRFNDMTRSVEVKHGTWEFCDESYFRGPCRVVEPGNYSRLGSLSGLITSARLVGRGDLAGVAGPVGPAAPHGSDEVVLYDARNFQGYLASLTVPTRDFDPLGFNDRVASIVVRRGSWEFCTDGDYRGTCRIYGPGQYASLPAGQDDAYSSARPVHRGQPGGATSKARIVLFEYPDFSGRSIALDSNARDLTLAGFNDRTESLVVERGRWRLCTDANGEGTCREVGPGNYPKLPSELRNRLSSAFVR